MVPLLLTLCPRSFLSTTCSSHDMSVHSLWSFTSYNGLRYRTPPQEPVCVMFQNKDGFETLGIPGRLKGRRRAWIPDAVNTCHNEFIIPCFSPVSIILSGQAKSSSKPTGMTSTSSYCKLRYCLYVWDQKLEMSLFSVKTWNAYWIRNKVERIGNLVCHGPNPCFCFCLSFPHTHTHYFFLFPIYLVPVGFPP